MVVETFAIVFPLIVLVKPVFAPKIDRFELFVELVKLLAVVALPIVLPETVNVPFVPWKPIPRALIVAVLEVEIEIPPTVLLLIVITPGVPVPALIPVKTTPAVVLLCTNAILPVTDWLPIVFGVMSPTLNEPVTSDIPDCEVDVLELVSEIF